MRLFVQSSRLNFLFPAIKYSALPLLAAVYPALFHYANNARLVLFSSLLEICIFLAGIGLMVYLLLVVFSRKKFPQSAMGALLIIVFFYIYGSVFDRLGSLDLVQVETYNFLPFWVFAAIYGAWTVTNLSTNTSAQAWYFSMLILGLLIIFNIIRILPVEIEKNKDDSIAAGNSVSAMSTAMADQQYPDIYYFIFDEAAGFEVARQYWHYNEVDDFVAFLETRDFYVAENSHSGSVITMREIATRLNYKDYPITYEDYGIYSEPIANNSVMQYLKSIGYTTVVYQEPQYVLPTEFPRLPADYLFDNPDKNMSNGIGVMDDFKRLVLDNTLLRPLVINITPGLEKHKDFIFYTANHLTSSAIPSPKFVYVHFLLPHAPFIFNANGGIIPQTTHYNWQAYFGNYQYSLKLAENIIQNILLAADPARPPVIILQSDHGARNLTNHPFSGFLEDYPDEYKTWIINALHLPNCEDAPLTQDMDPINTFPMVFNCYFDAHIPLK